MSEQKKDEGGREEPFILSILPFAGLGLLLLLAVVWRFLPEDKPDASAEYLARLAVNRWEHETVREIDVSPEKDFILGPDAAPVTIVEFSDFECPYCRSASSEVKQVVEEFGDDVRVVFKNLPLDTACNENLTQQLHPFACKAALTAWCAGRQEEELFWRMHDALFQLAALSDDAFARIARKLDLSADELATCMESEEASSAIQRDIDEASRLRVTGTPTFFVNGRKVADYRNRALAHIVEHVLEER